MVRDLPVVRVCLSVFFEDVDADGQIQAAGDRIRNGERGTRILSFKTHRCVAVKDEQGQPVNDKNGEQVYRHEKLDRPFTRIYTVFNVQQARNLKPEPKPEPGKAWWAHKRAEAVIQASGVSVKHVQGNRRSLKKTGPSAGLFGQSRPTASEDRAPPPAWSPSSDIRAASIPKISATPTVGGPKGKT